MKDNQYVFYVKYTYLIIFFVLPLENIHTHTQRKWRNHSSPPTHSQKLPSFTLRLFLIRSTLFIFLAAIFLYFILLFFSSFNSFSNTTRSLYNTRVYYLAAIKNCLRKVYLCFVFRFLYSSFNFIIIIIIT